MAACCGENHSITLSNDGSLHSFGKNAQGQLGLGHNNNVYLPTPIPNLPQIKMMRKETPDDRRKGKTGKETRQHQLGAP